MFGIVMGKILVLEVMLEQFLFGQMALAIPMNVNGSR